MSPLAYSNKLCSQNLTGASGVFQKSWTIAEYGRMRAIRPSALRRGAMPSARVTDATYTRMKRLLQSELRASATTYKLNSRCRCGEDICCDLGGTPREEERELLAHQEAHC